MNAKSHNHKARKANRKHSRNARETSDFSSELEIKAKRKLQARRRQAPGVWLGLGMIGVIGWSIVIPTLLGIALGIWLDNHFITERSWTLVLLIAGLILGCFNAWYWIDKEHQAMHNKQEHKDE